MPSALQRQTAADTLRKTATKHGMAAGENLLTYRAAQRVWNREFPLIWQPWRASLGGFARVVRDEIGLRPTQYHWIARLVELPYELELAHALGEICTDDIDHSSGPVGYYGTGNIEWRFFEPKERRRDRLLCRGCELCEECFCPFDVAWDCSCLPSVALRAGEEIERPHRIARPLPQEFVKGDWGHPDKTRQQAKRKARAAERRAAE